MRSSVIHYADYGLEVGFSVCGNKVSLERLTPDPEKVTCGICKRTHPYKKKVAENE